MSMVKSRIFALAVGDVLLSFPSPGDVGSMCVVVLERKEDRIILSEPATEIRKLLAVPSTRYPYVAIGTRPHTDKEEKDLSDLCETFDTVIPWGNEEIAQTYQTSVHA